MQQSLTLYELNLLVGEAIAHSLPGSYWVEAELSEVRQNAGHCYMTLVQKDLFGATAVARASAKCWRSNWQRVEQKFVKATRQSLAPGMKVLLSVTAEFHPAFGFSLIVSDIDPTYTIGDMAQRREEIVRQLKEEGVFDLQRELSLPLFCQRIAVVSSASAAGYGDFVNQLTANAAGFDFRVELFPAVMQGEQVEASIIAALNAINERCGDFDCVVVIRGGGAVADMSGFDTLLLAENVANFPLPIITGIGHDRDECVLDMVAHTKVKTPTAAAALLIERLSDVQQRIETAEATIVTAVARRLEQQRAIIEKLVTKISSYCAMLKQTGEAKLLRTDLVLRNVVSERLLREHHRLELLEQRLAALDPRLLLKRGYSLTTVSGRLVKSPDQLSDGDEILTLVARGKFKSVVKK